MRWDKNGKVILADVAPSGVSRVDPNATSGNPRHDTRSGKFGAGGGGRRGAPKPANADDLAFARMVDKVRQAAKELKGEPGVEEIQKWLKGKVDNPGQVDAEGFLKLVQQQRMSDLVDAIDNRLRGAGLINKGIKTVASRGHIKSILSKLTPDQIADVTHRLEALGNPTKNIDKFIGKRVAEGTLDAAAVRRQKLAASDYDIPALGIEYMPEVLELDLNTRTRTPDMAAVEMAEAMVRLAEAQQQQQPPVIHVTPQVTVNVPPRNTKLVRDPKTGIITDIEQENA